MNRYLATFAPGFEEIIGSLLLQSIPSASDIQISSGILFFSRSGPPDEVVSAAFFNNIFLILQEWKTNTCPFPEMVKTAAKSSRLPSVAPTLTGLAEGTFRVRYSRENQFCSVDKNVMENAERYITASTGLLPDRLNPGIEFWYIIRREGYSFFAVRLTKKQSTEKYLAQGELRPEIVQLIVGLARVSDLDRTLLDPFAGYGSIPERLALTQKDAVVYASDIDPARESDMKTRFSGNSAVSVRRADALYLSHIESASIDLIVTDPPWGFWDGDVYAGANSISSLYTKMLEEFYRVLSGRGRAIVLTGAKKEFEEAVSQSKGFVHCTQAKGYRTDILVNGKKSAIFCLMR